MRATVICASTVHHKFNGKFSNGTLIWGLDMGCLMLQFDDVLLFSSKECDKKNDTETTVIRDRSSWEIENCRVTGTR